MLATVNLEYRQECDKYYRAYALHVSPSLSKATGLPPAVCFIVAEFVADDLLAATGGSIVQDAIVHGACVDDAEFYGGWLLSIDDWANIIASNDCAMVGLRDINLDDCEPGELEPPPIVEPEEFANPIALATRLQFYYSEPNIETNARWLTELITARLSEYFECFKDSLGKAVT